MTISGAGFSGANAVVRSIPATRFTVNSATLITATSPAGAPVGGGHGHCSGWHFAYNGGRSLHVRRGRPQGHRRHAGRRAGRGGTVVTLTGGSFTGATTVSFGGTPATSFAGELCHHHHRDEAARHSRPRSWA